MFALFAIPIMNQAVGSTLSIGSFLNWPLDVMIFELLIWFGWIPIVSTLAWGFTQLWQYHRQFIYDSKLKYVLLAIDVPSMTEQSPKAFENFFSNLYGAKSTLTWKELWIIGKLHPVFSFEIISTEGYIQFLVRCQTRFRDLIEAGIYAHYPDAQISEVEDYAKYFPLEYPDAEYEMWGSEFTLDKPTYYPIRTYVDFEDKMTQEIKDPLAYTLEQLAKMKPGEHFWIQILVQPSTNDWVKPGMQYVKKIYGDVEKPKKSFITSAFEGIVSIPNEILKQAVDVDLGGLLLPQEGEVEEDQWRVFKITLPQKEEAEAILRKIGKVGHGVKIRSIYVAKKNVFVKIDRTGILKGIWNQYSHLSLNKFALYIPQIPKDDYFWMRWEYTKKQRILMKAYQNRSWGIGATPMFLNVEELATIWHFPTITMKAPLVKKSESKQGEPPVGLPITYMEQTLPGFGSDESEVEIGNLPRYVFSDVSDESIEGELPHPKSPTDSSARQSQSKRAVIEKKDLPVKQTDQNDGEATESFVPPNLPV